MEGNVSFTFHLQAPAFWKHTDTRKKKVTPKIAYCLCGANRSCACEQYGQLLLLEDFGTFIMADAGWTQQTMYFLANGSKNQVV